MFQIHCSRNSWPWKFWICIEKKDEKKDDANDDLDNSEDNFDQSSVFPKVEEVGEKKRQHDDGDHDDDDGERSKKKIKSSRKLTRKLRESTDM